MWNLTRTRWTPLLALTLTLTLTLTPLPCDGQTISSQTSYTSTSLPSAVPVESGFLFRYNGFADGQPLPVYTSVSSSGARVVAAPGADGSVRVVTFNAGDTAIVSTWTTPGEQVRGLDTLPDGGAVVLVVRTAGSSCSCSPPNCPGPCKSLHYVRFSSSGSVLDNDQLDHRIFDFSLGGGRLAHGGGSVKAYYKVSSTNTMCLGLEPGHQGDSAKQFTLSAGPPTPYSASASVSSPGWCWGSSHSMEERLVYNPTLATFGTVSISDCFPSKSVLFDKSVVIYAVDANCAGKTDGGLGGFVADGNGYAMTFTAPGQHLRRPVHRSGLCQADFIRLSGHHRLAHRHGRRLRNRFASRPLRLGLGLYGRILHRLY